MGMDHVFGHREDAEPDDIDALDTSTHMALLKGLLTRQDDMRTALEGMQDDVTVLKRLVTQGTYEEEAKAGNILMAHNTAAQAVTVALATTYTGLCLSNPNDSGVDLVMLGCNYALSVAPAGIASLHLLGGYSTAADVTHTTPLAAPGIRSSKINTGGSSAAKVDSAATISTPFYLAAMGSGFTAGALYATTPNWIWLHGSIVVPPGGFIAWGALTAVTGFGAFMWKEVTAS